MATKTIANNFRKMLGAGEVDFLVDNFRLILMDENFVFSANDDIAYADISGEELPEANGYTTQGKALVIDSAWDIVGNKASLSWNHVVFDAVGGDIGLSASAVVLLWDASYPAGSYVVGELRFLEPALVLSGSSLRLQDLGFDI